MDPRRRLSSSCTRRPLVVGRTMPVRLYSVSDSPPTLAVRMALEALGVDHQLVDVDFANGEHLTEEYGKKNPQKEVPMLDDNGFLLSESIAILQYLADKYSTDGSLYPKDPQKRAVVNHRLAFNLTTYYRYIGEHVMAPIFYAYKRTPESLKKMNIGLNVFNIILERQGTKYAAGDTLTIADFPLVTATACLEAIHFNISQYPMVAKWYENFKAENPRLWNIVAPGMEEVRAFESNPPDLSHISHPIHPTSKN
ncbi:glutathione S-transferase 1-like isoform X1 [Ischnura elegans]|uniref:glutathione S-transferase 1-like isoform X1 n=2 Tax=Ischnura elegans TaxID=197161 RepID=UPI001ED868E4|nr:glutathione S-transferase 1-like isoform X1 [Ischnura elegans]